MNAIRDSGGHGRKRGWMEERPIKGWWKITGTSISIAIFRAGIVDLELDAEAQTCTQKRRYNSINAHSFTAQPHTYLCDAE